MFPCEMGVFFWGGNTWESWAHQSWVVLQLEQILYIPLHQQWAKIEVGCLGGSLFCPTLFLSTSKETLHKGWSSTTQIRLSHHSLLPLGLVVHLLALQNLRKEVEDGSLGVSSANDKNCSLITYVWRLWFEWSPCQTIYQKFLQIYIL